MKIKILFLFAVLMYASQGFGQFVTSWNTGPFTTITVPTIGSGYNYTATIATLENPNVILETKTNVTGNAAFTGLATNTAYQIKITGAFPRIYFNNGGDKLKLKDITQWGNISWSSFNSAFYGCGTLNISATDVPQLSGVTNMSQMFQFCSALNGPVNIGNWNTATVTNMTAMFSGATTFDQNIGNWNTASVTNMSNMFANAIHFNQNIGNWNTAAVTDMNYMFYNAAAFNQNIGDWNIASVHNMDGMFMLAATFNQNIGSWNTSAVTIMRSMFNKAVAFNQNIGNWNTASVTDMSGMFDTATAFNQNIGNWNTAQVITMDQMFSNAVNFNQNIGGWNTSAVARMNSMFAKATTFNQNISNWDVSSVWMMLNMFSQASAFNQDLSSWDISAGTSMEAMFKQATSFNQNLSAWGSKLNPNAVLGSFFGGLFDDCGMSVANYDATLVGFSEFGPNGLTLAAAGMYYCNDGATARAHLVLPIANGGKGWNISGDTSLVTSTPLLATMGNTVTLTYANCNYDWSNPANRARKMLMMNPNGNEFSPTSVIINHNNVGILPAGISSNSGYYQTSNATNSARISNRLVTVSDVNSYSYTENGGIIARIYYSISEYTNIVVNAPPVGEIVDAGWFLSDANSAAAVVANMSAGNYASPGAEKIVPFHSGSENGIPFVEFKLKKSGTIGIYAKTQQGSLASELSTADLTSKINITIYPNPARNILNFKFSDERQIEIRQILIVNMLGQTVYNKTQKLTNIDISSLKTGMYQVSLLTNEGSWNGKFIKK